MPFRPILAIVPLAVVFLCGCGGGVSDNGPPTGGVGSHKTPKEVFAAIVTAEKRDDWNSFTSMLTVESQARMAASLIGCTSFEATLDKKKEQSLNELLDRHGLDLTGTSETKLDASYAEAMLEMFRPVDDIPRLIGDLAEWLDENSAEEHHGGLAEMRSVDVVSIEGDLAKAVAMTDRGEQAIEFRKVGGAWLLHFPDDEVDDAEPAKSTPRGPVIDAQGTVTGKITVMLSGEETTFDLKHAVAYRFEYQLAGPPTRVSTWVSLTPDKISSDDIATQLDRNQEDLMNAQPFFPDGPYIMMELDRNGGLTQVSGHALDNHFTAVSRAIAASGFQSNLVLDAGRVRGEIRLPSGSDEVLSFDGTIDVIHFAN